MAGTRVADAVAQTLGAYGTDVFFQVTGGDPALWSAFDDAGIRMILCRTEPGAVYMADGYARISGKPGFVYGQHGPGAANIAAALADALWAMSPVVSLTSSIALSGRNRFEYQDMDQMTFYRPVTRWAGEVIRVEDVERLLRSAIRAATSAPPGPVHLEIPRDLIGLEIKPSDVLRDASFGRVPSIRTAPDPQLIRRLVDMLAAARRPVLIAGSGVLISQAWEEVGRLAETLRLPVATTLGGKGSISELHPLSLGVIGRYSSVTANEIVAECDLAIVVGSRLGGMSTDSFSVPSTSTRIIHLDVDPMVLNANYPGALGIQTDAKLGLEATLAELEQQGTALRFEAWAQETSLRIETWKRKVEALRHGPANPIHPAAVIHALAQAMEPHDVLVADTGYMAAWAGVLFPIREAGRIFLRAAGSLGWALPASLGARLAAPGRRVACVIGDGGVAYHIAELETAVRCSIPAVIVVLNNGSLAFEYHLQKYVENRVIPRVNDFTAVDYAAVARALGAEGRRITNDEDLPQALQEAFEGERPTLLDVVVDREAIAPVTTYDSVLERDI